MSRPVGKLCGILLLAGSSLALAQQYTITTAAGGAPPPTPVAATSTSIGQPSRVTVDAKGNTYFSSGNTVFKMDGSGNLTVVAGNSRAGYSGDGGPALQAQLNLPQGIAFDKNGNLYIADSKNNRVRIVSSAGVISTFAGTGAIPQGIGGPLGDGGLAINALLRLPSGVFADSSGNVFIADTGDSIIRKVTPDGIINTVAGQPGYGGFWGDTFSALSAGLHLPTDVFVDSSGDIFIADSANAAIREVTASTGIINTVAGNAAIGDTGDGGPATSASLIAPYAVALDSSGNIYFARKWRQRNPQSHRLHGYYHHYRRHRTRRIRRRWVDGDEGSIESSYRAGPRFVGQHLHRRFLELPDPQAFGVNHLHRSRERHCELLRRWGAGQFRAAKWAARRGRGRIRQFLFCRHSQ